MNYANYSSSSKFTLEIIAPDQVPDPNYRGLGLNTPVGAGAGYNKITSGHMLLTQDKNIVPQMDLFPNAGKYARQVAGGVAAMALHTGISIASKSAGYAGNYIQQARINETMAFATRFGALGASFMTGNPAIIALATIGTGVSIGMSVWDYHEKIKIENLSASYQASYRGARMNAGKV
jgi:hypothetical protein|nr:MAG TPA: hypothetical protein [Caudoviricetes sp.]